MQRETTRFRLAGNKTVEVAEIRSGDTPVGEYPGGLWDGYEVCLRNLSGQVLDTAQVKTWGYPVNASVNISPDGKAFAVIAEGNDGFEQEDYTIGVYEIHDSGKLKTLYQAQRQRGRIVTEYPRLLWIQDAQIKIEWVTTGTFALVEPESIVIDRTNSEETPRADD